MMENETFNVGTLSHCDEVYGYEEPQKFVPLWLQTMMGCRIVQLLQDIYRFNISYVVHKLKPNYTALMLAKEFNYDSNISIDIYTRPITLRSELLESGYAVQPIYNWRFGFLLLQPEDDNYLQLFYSKPFTRPLWNSLYITAIIISIIFFLLQLWEKRVVGRVHENGIIYEMLIVMGSHCQHSPPLYAVLSSRRTAYFVFLIFSFIIYSFYTSNLLSHLVNDKNGVTDITTLSTNNFEFVITDHAKFIIQYLQSLPDNGSQSGMIRKLFELEPVTILDGLQKVKKGKCALLSDYTSLYPYLNIAFKSDELCNLIRVDLFSNIIIYLFTSNNFTYKEQIKIGIQKMKEAGLLKRQLSGNLKPSRNCHPTKHFQTQFIQIFSPLTTLLCSYVLSLLILIGERFYFKRFRLFPYTD